MSIHTVFLKFHTTLHAFISSIFNKELNNKLDDLADLKQDFFKIKRKLNEFFVNITDETQIDEQPNEIVTIKKFYLNYLDDVDKLITRLDVTYHKLYEMERDFLKNFD